MERLQERGQEGGGSNILLEFPGLFCFCMTLLSAFPAHGLFLWAIHGRDFEGPLGSVLYSISLLPGSCPGDPELGIWQCVYLA